MPRVKCSVATVAWSDRERVRCAPVVHAAPVLVWTRGIIYERIWDYDFGGESNIIEVYIRYLRTKLEANGEPRSLQTVRGVGYVLREE